MTLPSLPDPIGKCLHCDKLQAIDPMGVNCIEQYPDEDFYVILCGDCCDLDFSPAPEDED
jgi:hypothetical protein